MDDEKKVCMSYEDYLVNIKKDIVNARLTNQQLAQTNSNFLAADTLRKPALRKNVENTDRVFEARTANFVQNYIYETGVGHCAGCD